jgi:hypothetical protein
MLKQGIFAEIQGDLDCTWQLAHDPINFRFCLRSRAPLLAELACSLFATVANSVPSERAFSVMKIVQTVKRTRLSHQHVDQLTFSYSNGPKIDKMPYILRSYNIGLIVKLKS